MHGVEGQATWMDGLRPKTWEGDLEQTLPLSGPQLPELKCEKVHLEEPGRGWGFPFLPTQQPPMTFLICYISGLRSKFL